VSRSLIVTLVAGAAFAVAALASGGASAKPLGISPGPMGISKPMPGPMGIVKPPMGFKPILGVIKPPPKPVLGLVIPPHFPGVVIPHPGPGPQLGWWWWRHHHRFPLVIEEPVSVPVAVTRPVVTGPAPVEGPCTCLTKTYLNDGSVKFTDVCTKETAIATPDEQRAQR